MPELFCALRNIILEPVHIISELILNCLKFVSLHFECCNDFCRIVSLFDDCRIKAALLPHALLCFLQLGKSIISFDIFAECLLHVINNVGTFCVIRTIECIDILMPLVNIAYLLVVNLVIDL